ncbi:MAG: FAD-binding protein, partial [Actinomycetota bacterium]
MIEAVFAVLAERLGDRVTRSASSAEFTTYRCGGPFAVLVRAGTLADLDALVAARAQAPGIPVLVVGRGSNLLVADAGFPGIALTLDGEFETIDVRVDTAEVEAGGAAPLPVLARRAAAAGVGGLEFLVGIPGSVGGAVRMNAGGHGAEIRDVLRSARIFDLATGARRTAGPEGLGFGFRTSAVAPTEVVVGARVGGVRADPVAAGER